MGGASTLTPPLPACVRQVTYGVIIVGGLHILALMFWMVKVASTSTREPIRVKGD